MRKKLLCTLGLLTTAAWPILSGAQKQARSMDSGLTVI
jgi:hypothetical protein